MEKQRLWIVNESILWFDFFFPYGISNIGLTSPYRSLLIHYDWGPVTFRRWIITIYIHFRFRIITSRIFFFCQITTAPINPFRFHEKKLNFFVSLFFAYLINCGKSSILFFLSLHKKNDRLPPTWKTTNTTLLIVCSVFNHLDFSEKPVY